MPPSICMSVVSTGNSAPRVRTRLVRTVSTRTPASNTTRARSQSGANSSSARPTDVTSRRAPGCIQLSRTSSSLDARREQSPSRHCIVAADVGRTRRVEAREQSRVDREQCCRPDRRDVRERRELLRQPRHGIHAVVSRRRARSRRRRRRVGEAPGECGAPRKCNAAPATTATSRSAVSSLRIIASILARMPRYPATWAPARRGGVQGRGPPPRT